MTDPRVRLREAAEEQQPYNDEPDEDGIADEFAALMGSRIVLEDE